MVVSSEQKCEMEQTDKLKQGFWSYWNLFIEELQYMIFSNDISNIQCLLDSLNLEISKVIEILTETFDVTHSQQEELQKIRLSEPFSKFFSNQSLEVFLVSKDLSSYDVKVEAATDLDIKIDPDNVKSEEPEDKIEKGDAKWAHHRKYYVSKCYKPEYPISEEEYNQMILKAPPYVCPKCLKAYKDRKSIEKHLLKKCVGIPMIWPKWKRINEKEFYCDIQGCEQSSKSFISTDAVWRHHYEVHAVHAKKKYKCDQCSKGFLFVGDLNHHVKVDHSKSENQVFICKYCAKTFKRKGALKEHELSHTDNKDHFCPHCDYKSNRKRCVDKHIKARHVFDSSHICDQCGKSFNTNDKLKRHILTHSDIGQKCELCGKIMKNLKRHIFTAHKVTYKCPECPRVFQAVKGVEAHRKKEHGYQIFKNE